MTDWRSDPIERVTFGHGSFGHRCRFCRADDYNGPLEHAPDCPVRRGMSLGRAIQIATLAHEGQADKSGQPYILHPLAVMNAVSEHAKVVAVLHDVVEDTDVTIDDLVREGLGTAEAEALVLLTRRDDETYRQYIDRLAESDLHGAPLARAVKLADIDHNLGRLTPELAGLERRYERARARLLAL